MKILLYIRRELVDQIEFEKPEAKGSFEDREILNEFFIKHKIGQLKYKHRRQMENFSWEVILIAESKMNEPVPDYVTMLAEINAR